MQGSRRNILVVGGTGYVGSKLIPRLCEKNHPIRCLTRSRVEKKKSSFNDVTFVRGDLLNAESLHKPLQGIDTVFYLAHSLDEKDDFEEKEKQAAQNFGAAAHAAGVRRIIYLGGLAHDPAEDLSPHLRSRIQVGNTLRASGIQVIEFQASIILGRGSLSFEMIRALSERLPVMIMPRWVRVKAQPICICDLALYLVQAVDLQTEDNEIFEIGGADQVSYKDLIAEYCRQRGLKRLLVPVPVLTPWLSGLWLGLVTPVYARVGQRLVESIKSPTVVQSDRAGTVFPDIKPMGMGASIEYALREIELFGPA
ncbi:NmrA family NAD(P)-binding protein [Nitrospina watsonii]|uniref:NAD-dependent epimerase/dehydratase n=1 Tax=Nitrospina watsonii TaxID=1323948 RepID=A0ABM9HFI6_9BACT|nr:NmrA family NAD(P)-binding protein [Nitrospina watsonii]CAI2718990.1 Putative NAD-dependent epimerase/dehydratase [Nitrospina watsonii]